MLVTTLWAPYAASGQVGIGTTTPHSSAQLELATTTRGFLPPRVTDAEMYAIASPAVGLVVFNTTYDRLFYYNLGASTWVSVGSGLGGDDWGTQTAAATGFLTGDGTAGDPLRLVNGAAVGDMPYWNGTAWLAGTNPNQWTHDGTNVWRPAGNVGIGVASPANTRLSVGAPVNGTYAFMGHNLGATKGLAMGFAATGNTVFVGYNGYYDNSGVSRSMAAGRSLFQAYNTSTGEYSIHEALFGASSADEAVGLQARLRILGNGNVGVGGSSTVPYRFHVGGFAGPGIITQIGLENPSAATVGNGNQMVFACMRTGSIRTDVAGVGGVMADIATGRGDAFLAAHNGTSLVERFRVRGDGTVGVGTPTPARRLHIAGGLRVDTLAGGGSGQQLVTTTNTGDVFYLPTGTGVLANDGAGNLTWAAPAGDNLGNHTATQNLNLATYTLVGEGGTDGLYIDSNGNIGIGTTTPGYKLEVNQASTATSGSVQGSRIYSALSNTAPSTANYAGLSLFTNADGSASAMGGSVYGLQSLAFNSNAAGVGTLVGAYQSAINSSGGGSITTAYGSLNVVEHNHASATMATAIGTQGAVLAQNAGTLTSAIGVLGKHQLASTSAVSNAYSFYASAPNIASGGSIGSHYGVYVEDLAVAGVGQASAFYYAGSVPFAVRGNGNVGIGTATPAAQLHTTGSVRFAGVPDTTGQGAYRFLMVDPATGILRRLNAPLPGDNLGNHTATQNLNLATYTLVGEGGTSGIYISNAGNVGMGTSTPAYTAQVVGSGAIHSATNPSFGNPTASGTFVACSPNTFGQCFTATQTGEIVSIEVGFNAAQGPMTLTLDLFVGNTNTGTPDQTTNITLASAQGPGYVKFDLAAPFPVVVGQQYSFRLSTPGCFTSIWNSTSNPYAGGDRFFNGSPSAGWDIQFRVNYLAGGLYVASNGNVGIGTATPTQPLQATGGVSFSGLPAGAASQMVYIDPASGILSRAAAPSGADNLGNHTATQNLDLDTYTLVGGGGTSGLRIDANGLAALGGAPVGGARLVSYATGDVSMPLRANINGTLTSGTTTYGVYATGTNTQTGVGIQGMYSNVQQAANNQTAMALNAASNVTGGGSGFSYGGVFYSTGNTTQGSVSVYGSVGGNAANLNLTAGRFLVIGGTAIDPSGASYAVRAENNGTGGNNAYGLAATVTGTATTSYGLFGSVTGASTTNYGLYASASGATNNYAAALMGGNVGIGVATPTSLLHLSATATATAGTHTMQTNVYGISPSGASTASYTGQAITLTASGANSTSGTVYGQRIAVSHTASTGGGALYGNLTTIDNNSATPPTLLLGHRVQARQLSGGAINTANGVLAEVTNSGGGSISTASALYTGVFNTGTGSINTANGLYVQNFSNPSGTITVANSILVDELTVGTTRRAFYYASASRPFALLANGNVGMGLANPTNVVDIQPAARTGTHASNQPFYATGTVDDGAAAQTTSFQFRHSNGTQGIGLGFNTIFATGSNTDQNLGLAARGPAGMLVFSTAGSERMTIVGNGNVGIGTNAPAAQLHTTGTVRMAGLGTTGTLSGYQMAVVNTTTGQVERYTGSLPGDNLGDHTATMNLNIGSFAVNAGSGFGLRFDASGNASFGAPAPTGTVQLAVQRNASGYAGSVVNVDNNAGSNGLLVNTANTAANTYPLLVNSNATPRLVVLGTGNVGIGTTTPNAALQLGNVVANRRIVLWEDANNDHNYYGFGINGSTLRYQVPSAAAQHLFTAGKSATASNNLMVIKGNGAVGINTTAPYGQFNIQGYGMGTVDLNIPDYAGCCGVGGGGAVYQTWTAGATGVLTQIWINLAWGYNLNSVIRIYDGAGTGGAILYESSVNQWNVGFIHEIEGLVNITSGNVYTLWFSNGEGLNFRPDNYYAGGAFSINPTYDLEMATWVNTSASPEHYLAVRRTGAVGVGHTPYYRLDVRNDIADYSARILNGFNTNAAHGLVVHAGSNGAAGAYMINFLRNDGTQIGSVQQNTAGSVAYNNTSDARLKHLLGTTQYGLSDLMAVRVYDYYYHADSARRRMTGVVAQELAEVYPSAVTAPRNPNAPASQDPWMVDYSSLTPLIIRSVQQQQEQIAALLAEVAQLRALLTQQAAARR